MVQKDDLIKVGWTADLARRLTELDHPTLIHWLPMEAAYWTEQAVHRALAPYRYLGEWYTLTAEQVDALPALIRDTPPISTARVTSFEQWVASWRPVARPGRNSTATSPRLNRRSVSV